MYWLGGIRTDEIMGEEQAQEQSADVNTQAGWGIRAICHDILSANHDRDYQALGMFLLPAVWKFAASEVAVIEIQPNDKAIYHLYPAFPVENQSIISPAPHRGHVMWGKPTSSTTETEWRDWV